jgi:hypothetical protein
VNWTKGENARKVRHKGACGNGVDGVMVPAENSYIITRDTPEATLILYPRSGHAFLFQYAEDFSDEVECFLRK